MTKFVLYGGKGGVGKTTCAAATALKLSKRGNDTLVVSTDPAHSLSDIFDNEVPSRPEELFDHLWAVEIDPEDAMREYKEKLQAMPDEELDEEEGAMGDMGMGMGMDMGGMGLGGEAGGIGSLDDLMDDTMMGPGSDEAAAMNKFMEYMDSERWDYIIFDTAPTGHTLRFLELPEVMDSMVGKMIKVRTQLQGFFDSIKGMFGGQGAETQRASADDLDELKERIERIRSMLRDPEITDFRVVLIPEKMAVLETQRLIERLSQYEIPMRTVIVNKVMEDINQDCEFCQARWEVQRKNLEEANETFRGLNIQHVPLLKEEVHGIETLEKVAERIEV